MGFLHTIPVDKDFARKAFSLLKEALIPLPKPASIVEIGLDEDDYEQLKAWLAQKHWDSHIESALITGLRSIDQKSGHTDSEIIGLLLHALYAEHSRRSGAEWLYWPVIRKLEWHYSVEHWFSGNHPTLAHKHVLASAAEKFGLRNSFDDGGAEWFMTGKLQFGFTRRGAEEKLQEWLVNPHCRTVAIRALLGDDDLGMESKSFKELFATLISFRNDNLSESRARVQLERSPWVLPEVISELLKAAKRSASESPEGGDYVLQPEFLAQPLMRSAGTAVSFHIEISGLSSIGLEEKDHEIVDAESKVIVQLRHVEGGGFRCLPPSIVVPWDESQNELTYTLRQTGSPATIATQNVRCWEPADWVQVFSAEGRRFRNEKSIPQQVLQSGFDIICPVSCTLVGMFISKASIDGNWMLYHGVQATAASNVKVTHETDVIWDSQSAKTQDSMLQQANLQVDISPIMGHGGRFSGQCSLRLALHPLFQVKRVQVGRHSLDPARCCQVGGVPFSVDQDEWCISLPVIVRVQIPQTGQSGIIRTRVNMRPPTFIWMKDALSMGSPFKYLLTSGEPAPRLGVGPILRDGITAEDGQLFEGDTFRGKCPQAAFRPANLAGLGEKLDIWPGVFNEPADQWVLAGGCVDQGVIKRCIYLTSETDSMSAQIKVSKSSAKSNTIEWVACLTGPRVSKIEVISHQDRDIVLSLPPETSKESLLAIFALYEGRRIGSWFNKQDASLPYLVVDVARDKDATDESAVLYAAIMRAGKLPLMDANTAYHLRAWINQRPIQAFLALLKPVIRVDTVGLCEAGEGSTMRDWNRAVGRIYESNPNKGCKTLTLEDALEVLRFFNSDQPIGRLLSKDKDGLFAMIEIARQMAYVSPVLARDVLKLVATQTDSGLTATAWLSQIKQSLHCSNKDICELTRQLRAGINDTFFQTTLNIKADADPIALRNLRVLLQLPTPNDRARHAARDQRTAYLLSQ